MGGFRAASFAQLGDAAFRPQHPQIEDAGHWGRKTVRELLAGSNRAIRRDILDFHARVLARTMKRAQLDTNSTHTAIQHFAQVAGKPRNRLGLNIDTLRQLMTSPHTEPNCHQ
jgi:hypothetical protein